MTKIILAVLAHPDDESFGMGGTLALYARKGYDVYYVCATRGEAGTVDPEHMKGFNSVGELREGELRCAAQHLGLKDVFLLDYRDSGMLGMEDNKHPDAQINHSIDEVAGKVVKYIRELKPDIVLTFDPIGGYRHPDHIHIQQATVLAFEKSDDASFHPESGLPFKARALYFHVDQYFTSLGFAESAARMFICCPCGVMHIGKMFSFPSKKPFVKFDRLFVIARRDFNVDNIPFGHNTLLF